MSDNEATMSRAFTDGQLANICAWYSGGRSFQEVADKFTEVYGIEVSRSSVRHAYNKYGIEFESDNKIADAKVLKSLARTRLSASQTAKENRALTKEILGREDLIEQIKEAVGLLPQYVAQIPEYAPIATGTPMTVELMLSDLHFGKKSKTFNIGVAKLRLRKYVAVALAEIERKRLCGYDVERIVVALLGDLIENALMHGKESTSVCEFNNPEQVRQAIVLLFAEVMLPLAETGIPISVVAISGNHDRDDEKPTYNDPGKNSLAWIIYTTLQLLCDQAGMTNVKWDIPDGVYAVLNIYGDSILYEHADRIKGPNEKKTYLQHLAKRSAQLKTVLKGIRVGHYHEYSCYDNGVAIVNGSLCGQDSYADVNGYATVPGLVLNFYVKTKNRDSSYYHSFFVQL